jgi:hypothetical protein
MTELRRRRRPVHGRRQRLDPIDTSRLGTALLKAARARPRIMAKLPFVESGSGQTVALGRPTPRVPASWLRPAKSSPHRELLAIAGGGRAGADDSHNRAECLKNCRGYKDGAAASQPGTAVLLSRARIKRWSMPCTTNSHPSPWAFALSVSPRLAEESRAMRSRPPMELLHFEGSSSVRCLRSSR